MYHINQNRIIDATTYLAGRIEVNGRVLGVFHVLSAVVEDEIEHLQATRDTLEDIWF